MNLELPRNTDDLLELAEKKGWDVSKRKTNGHWKLISPEGKTVGMSGTPSDWRAENNFRMQLKRAGLTPEGYEEQQERLRREAEEASNIQMMEKAPEQEQKKPSEPAETFATPDEIIQESQESIFMPAYKNKSGNLKYAVIKAFKKMDPNGQGKTARDMLDAVRVYSPKTSSQNLSVALAGYAKTGICVRVGPGIYKLGEGVKEDETMAEVMARNRTARAAGLLTPSTKMRAGMRTGDKQTDDDLQAFEIFMDALSEFDLTMKRATDKILAAAAGLDEVIRRHRKISAQVLQMRNMLNGVEA